LKGEWIPKEETIYYVTKNNFDTKGFPEVTEATVRELREQTASNVNKWVEY